MIPTQNKRPKEIANKPIGKRYEIFPRTSVDLECKLGSLQLSLNKHGDSLLRRPLEGVECYKKHVEAYQRNSQKIYKTLCQCNISENKHPTINRKLTNKNNVASIVIEIPCMEEVLKHGERFGSTECRWLQ